MTIDDERTYVAPISATVLDSSISFLFILALVISLFSHNDDDDDNCYYNNNYNPRSTTLYHYTTSHVFCYKFRKVSSDLLGDSQQIG